MSWKLALHTVSYAGAWRGQAFLPMEKTLEKAKELGYDGIMLMAKRPHVSPLDYSQDDSKQLREKIDKLGLEIACLAGYVDFTAGIERPMAPMGEIQAIYICFTCHIVLFILDDFIMVSPNQVGNRGEVYLIF